MRSFRCAVSGAAIILVSVFATGAEATSLLGSAANFAVLGGAATDTGLTHIDGDIGVASKGGFVESGTTLLVGALHQGDATALTAQSDAASAHASLLAMPADVDLSGQDLGSVGVLKPGIYRFGSSAQLTGALVLDFAGLHDRSFIFQIGSTLTTASGASVVAENGDAGSGIYWEIGSSATLGTGTTFAGNIIADQSITLDTAASIVCGRAIALNGAVTLDTNVVSANCAAGGDHGTGRTDFGSDGFSGGVPGIATPEPASWSMMLLGFACLGSTMRRSRRQSSPAN